MNAILLMDPKQESPCPAEKKLDEADKASPVEEGVKSELPGRVAMTLKERVQACFFDAPWLFYCMVLVPCHLDVLNPYNQVCKDGRHIGDVLTTWYPHTHMGHTKFCKAGARQGIQTLT